MWLWGARRDVCQPCGARRGRWGDYKRASVCGANGVGGLCVWGPWTLKPFSNLFLNGKKGPFQGGPPGTTAPACCGELALVGTRPFDVARHEHTPPNQPRSRWVPAASLGRPDQHDAGGPLCVRYVSGTGCNQGALPCTHMHGCMHIPSSPPPSWACA